MTEYAVPEDKLEKVAKEMAKKYTDIIEHDGKKYGLKVRIDVLDENGNLCADSITTELEEIKEGK